MTLDLTVTDMFCGAGGSTTGAAQAGASVRLAINHWERAIETHNTNYPNVVHALTDLHTANPRCFPSTTILLASPECTSHSLAKGRKRKGQNQPGLWGPGAPNLEADAEERSRCTMWTPLDWAEYHDYQAVLLENVVDVHWWRPFSSWLHAWSSLGYDYEVLSQFDACPSHTTEPGSLVLCRLEAWEPTPQSEDHSTGVLWHL